MLIFLLNSAKRVSQVWFHQLNIFYCNITLPSICIRLSSLVTSMNMAEPTRVSSRVFSIKFVIHCRRTIMLCLTQKPNCPVLGCILSIIVFFLFSRIFTNNFGIIGNSNIGRYDLRSLIGFPCLDSIFMSTTFYIVGFLFDSAVMSWVMFDLWRMAQFCILVTISVSIQ